MSSVVEWGNINEEISGAEQRKLVDASARILLKSYSHMKDNYNDNIVQGNKCISDKGTTTGEGKFDLVLERLLKSYKLPQINERAMQLHQPEGGDKAASVEGGRFSKVIGLLTSVLPSHSPADKGEKVGVSNEAAVMDSKAAVIEFYGPNLINVGERCLLQRADFENDLKGVLRANVKPYQWNHFDKMVHYGLEDKVIEKCNQLKGEGLSLPCNGDFIEYIKYVHDTIKTDVERVNLPQPNVNGESERPREHIGGNEMPVVDAAVNNINVINVINVIRQPAIEYMPGLLGDNYGYHAEDNVDAAASNDDVGNGWFGECVIGALEGAMVTLGYDF